MSLIHVLIHRKVGWHWRWGWSHEWPQTGYRFLRRIQGYPIRLISWQQLSKAQTREH